jgi:hypothetical protein
MKSALVLFALLPLVPPALNAQTSPAERAKAVPGASSNAGATSAEETQSEVEKDCKSKAVYQPAYEYCHEFAVLVSGRDTSHAALTQLVNLNVDAAALANAYSIYKTHNQVSEADQKAAVNNMLSKQVSAPATDSGSTSLVAKSIATNLVAVAVESGALTQSQSGNTITLEANPGNLFREAFLGTPEMGYLPKKHPFLESFTASAGLATSTSSNVTVPTTGSATSSTVNTSSVLFNSSATKLSSLTVNYEFNNKLSQRYIQKYLEKNKLRNLFIKPDSKLSPVADKARAVFVQDFASYNPANGCAAGAYQALASSSSPKDEQLEQFIAKFDGCFDAAVASANQPGSTLDGHWTAYNQALEADIASFQKSLKNELSGWDASAQYVFNKPVGMPETHDFRFVGNGDLSKNAGSTWTANGAFSLYGSVPTGAQYGRLKDAQMSGELDKSLGARSSSPSFSLAGYGQYQSKPSVLSITSSSVPSGVTLPANAQVFLSGTQGWLGVVQAKITIHVGGAQIPVAAKWSNKTDLLDKSKLGGQFGVSYDFSQLKQLIGQGSTGN